MSRAMNRRLLELLRDDSGVTSIEYAFLASLIAVVCVSAMNVLGRHLDWTFDQVKFALKG